MSAEDARSQMTERTRRGRVHKARKAALMPGAYRMYGYRDTPKQAGMPPRVEIHPEQADVVRAIVGWLLHEQRTTRHIVKRFNAQPLPTRTGRNHVGHAASVRSMLPKMLYTGHRYDHQTKTGGPRTETRRTCNPRKDNSAREGRPPEAWVPITAPAIIRAPICVKAQEQRQRHQEKARRASQPPSQRYRLRTRVRCGHCQ